MKHPYIVNANANERLKRMLAVAELHRQVKRISTQQPGRNIFNELKKRIPALNGPQMDESASSPV